MIFPIGDENVKNGAKPILSYAFIVINVLVFLYMEFLPEIDTRLIFYHYGAIPIQILEGKGLLSLVTNTFLHSGWMHIGGNMLFLWIFSDNIEAVLGNIGFLVFYLLGGVIASMVHVYFNQVSGIPAVGASGALSAVMGAYLVFFPKSKIKVLVLILFRKVYISALYFLGLWFVMQLVSSFSEIGKDPNSGGTAWWAHIGGFIFGLMVAFILNKTKIIDTNKYYIKA